MDYIRKNNENQTREAGFIAQDVEALLNEMGIENNGLICKDHEGSLELRYNDFIPILAKAIQEQQVMIEAQQSEIKSLQQQINEIHELIVNK